MFRYSSKTLGIEGEDRTYLGITLLPPARRPKPGSSRGLWNLDPADITRPDVPGLRAATLILELRPEG